jgi:hypothetical protein
VRFCLSSTYIPVRDLSKMMKVTKTVTVPFRFLTVASTNVTSLTASFQEIDLVPSAMGTRMADLSDNWQRYRFTKLKVSAFCTNIGTFGPATYVNSYLVAVAYDNSASSHTGAISGFAPASQLMKYAATSRDVCSFHVSRKELLGDNAVKWWETASTGNIDDEFRFQGCIYWQRQNNFADADCNTHLLIEGVCDFSNPVDPADDVDRLRRRVQRDMQRLTEIDEKKSSDDLTSEADSEQIVSVSLRGDKGATSSTYASVVQSAVSRPPRSKHRD